MPPTTKPSCSPCLSLLTSATSPGASQGELVYATVTNSPKPATEEGMVTLFIPLADRSFLVTQQDKKCEKRKRRRGGEPLSVGPRAVWLS